MKPARLLLELLVALVMACQAPLAGPGAPDGGATRPAVPLKLAASTSAVANVAQLAAVLDSGLADGSEVFVATARVSYELRRVTLAQLPSDPSPIKYIAASSGTGVWVQSDAGDDTWRVPRTWFVDGAIGNDEAQGTDSNPMQTAAGVLRRLGMGRRPKLPFLVTLVYRGLSVTENMTIDADLEAQGTFRIQFQPEIVATGTIDAAHFNLGPFTPGEDITIHATSFSWGSYLVATGLPALPAPGLHFRIDITSGNAAGASLFVLKDLGGGTARVTYPATCPGNQPLPPTCTSPSYPITTPATFNVVQLPYVSGAIVDAIAWGTTPQDPSVAESRFEIRDAALETWYPLSWSICAACFVNIFQPQAPQALPINTVFGSIYFILPGHTVATYSGGFLDSLYINEGASFYDEGPIFEGITVEGDASRSSAGTSDVHERGGFFDLPQPIVVQDDRWVLGSIFGNGNTTAIFQVNARRELAIKAGASLAATTSAPVEVLWGLGNGATSAQARPYTASTDTLGALQNTTFANVSTNLAAGGYRRAEGAAIVLSQN